ncbi:PD-(D/E)XK motif protein [Flavobacterium sp. KJJ]|uniref:PD-(D/E)XK motif protein n=1 Tax=Flavobacterium sp. KJJ TaxID=1270193 RepID=UPI0004930681|nr:PD-(D/E)XK motif protein [Flavobacterium sp. KJJ]
MEIAELHIKWNIISDYEITNGYKSIILSPQCKSNLYLGVNKDSNRCLILSLPENHNINFRTVIKEKLSIELFIDTNYIVLKLIDNSFYELFDDLIISMYNRIKDLSDVNYYSKEFIQTFYKWNEFFNDMNSFLLSCENIKGLFGELFLLQSYIDNMELPNINDILNSWTGPFDKRHDFTLDQKDIEVKTKTESKVDVTISSEYQLETNLDKELELVVISVIENEGYSIQFLIKEIKTKIQLRSGDYTLFLKALNLKGIDLKNAGIYNDYLFKPVSQITYNCTSLNFPKIVRSSLLKEISKVKYNLRISALSNFITSELHF